MAIDKIPKVGKIYKTVTAAYNALKKGFTSQTKREPNPIEDKMIMEEAKNKIQAQGDNISILDDYKEEGIESLASGDKGINKFVDESGEFTEKSKDIFKKGLKGLEENMLNNTDYQNKKKAFDELENFTISDEDVVQNLVDQKFGKGYFDNVEEVSFAPGMDKRGKVVKESPSQRQADLDRPFVTDEEMSAFTMEQNAKKLNKAKGVIDKLGANTTRQKLFVADLVEDVGQGIFDNVDMGAVVRSNMFDDLIEQGIDEDLLTKIMYSDTKSDDFAITLAKIKSNAADESIDIAPGTGVDVNETIDFYGRVFDELNIPRTKKAVGGLAGILGV